MAEMIPAEGMTIENQENWRVSVENNLGVQNLWDVVSGAFARPPDGDGNLEEWKTKNDAALGAIRNSSGSHNSHHLRGVLEAKRAWEILTHIYDDPPGYVKVLNQQIYANNLNGVIGTLNNNEGALTARMDDSGQTALHVAAQAGHLGIVQELITRLHPDDLLIYDDDSYTPLSSVAFVGVDNNIATAIFEANRDTLTTPDRWNRLPVAMAFSHDHKELGLHLYTATIAHLQLPPPDQGLRIHNLPNGKALAANLLGSCFISQQLATALDFINKPGNHYLLLEVDDDGMSAIERIARLQGRDTPVAMELLNKVCEDVGLLVENSRGVAIALFLATKEGNVEFVKRVLEAYPNLMVLCDSETIWNVFFYAVAYRQAHIFDHIRVLRIKDTLASMRDNDRNTLLHVVAKLDSPAKLKLNSITGPALQLQRELQWFKEVESVVRQRTS